MAELAPAARVGDPITHSPMLGLALAGIGIGLVIGVVAVTATVGSGGAAIPVAIAAAGDISTVCSWVGGGFLVGKIGGFAAHHWKALGSVTGAIADGASTVFIGPGCPAAARYLDPVHCKEPPTTAMGALVLGSLLSPGLGPLAAGAVVHATSEHAGATMAQGSETVLTEGKSQSRVGDRTSCGGTVSKGCDSVGIGGPPNAEVSWDAEIPEELAAVMTGVYWVGALTGALKPRTMPKKLLYAGRVLLAEVATAALSSKQGKALLARAEKLV